MTLLAIDSGCFESAREVEDIVLAPGDRVDMLDMLVTVRSGTSVLRSLAYDRGASGGMMGGGMMSATINNRVFDAARVDPTVQFDSVEEWLLTNTSMLDHPLHLHVWPMRIVAEGEQPVQGVKWQNVVNVPAHGSVRVRIAFDDFTGAASTTVTFSIMRIPERWASAIYTP
jgi:FtsP/CotA-like multicopper oxidase with cupredoxin domain